MAVESASTDMMDIQIAVDALNTELRGKESVLHTKTRVRRYTTLYTYFCIRTHVQETCMS